MTVSDAAILLQWLVVFVISYCIGRGRNFEQKDRQDRQDGGKTGKTGWKDECLEAWTTGHGIATHCHHPPLKLPTARHEGNCPLFPHFSRTPLDCLPAMKSGGAWDYPKATAVDKAYAQLTLTHLPLPGTLRCCILDSRSSLIFRDDKIGFSQAIATLPI